MEGPIWDYWDHLYLWHNSSRNYRISSNCGTILSVAIQLIVESFVVSAQTLSTAIESLLISAQTLSVAIKSLLVPTQSHIQL